MRAAGLEIDPADFPPGLEWEAPIWDLFTNIHTQWRDSGGLDYGPALVLIAHRGWDPDLSLTLLRTVEKCFMEARRNE